MIPVSPEIHLRLFTKEDVVPIFEIIQNQKEYLHEWIEQSGNLQTKNDIHQYIIRNRQAYDLIINNEIQGNQPGFQFAIDFEGKPIGQVGFQGINKRNNFASVGYWISKEYQGRGFVTMACQKLIEFGFSEMNINRIEIQCAVDNPASAAIARRLGFMLEGTLAQVEKRDAIYIDHFLFSKFKNEFRFSSESEKND